MNISLKLSSIFFSISFTSCKIFSICSTALFKLHFTDYNTLQNGKVIDKSVVAVLIHIINPLVTHLYNCKAIDDVSMSTNNCKSSNVTINSYFKHL
jgi:hypothetical protein